MLTRTARACAGVALALLVVMAGIGPFAGGDPAFAKGKLHHHKGPSADVAVQSITFTPFGTDPRQRTVTVHLVNSGNQAVGPFVVDLDATRTGATRPTSASSPVNLNAGGSTDVTFVFGCKWLNGANNASVTAGANPAPVPGETGGVGNNTKIVAPNLDFTGVDMCTESSSGLSPADDAVAEA